MCYVGGRHLGLSWLKVEQCSSHLTALISQSGRAMSWRDQASLEAPAQLPDLPVSHNSSLGSDCQAQRRLCDRQTVVCGSPQRTWAIGRTRPSRRECVCELTVVCMCLYAYSPALPELLNTGRNMTGPPSET